MKQLLFVISLLFFVNVVGAQDPTQIPLYKKRLAAYTQDSDRVQALSLLCFHYAAFNSDTAFYYGFKGKKLAEKIKNERAIANVNNSLGWAYFKKHNYDSAEILFFASLDIWKKKGLINEQAKTMSNLGVLYMDKTNYSKSLQFLKQALIYYDSVHDYVSKAVNMQSIGRLYNILKNYPEARKYFEEASVLNTKNNNEQEAATDLLGIANTYRYEQNFTNAINYYNKCIPVFKKANNHSSLGLTYENKAGAYGEMKEYILALEQYQLAIEQYKITGNKTDLYYGTLGTGFIYLEINDFKNAGLWFNNALGFAKDLKDANLEYQVLENISELYKKTGDYKGAYDMLKASRVIKDSLFTIDKQNELLKLQTQFETENKEKENQVLKAKNETSTIKLRQNTILLISSGIALFALAFLLLNSYRIKEAKAKHIIELENLNAQLNEQKDEVNRINTILELKALRAQMNPHFIFNCMSSIQECMLTGRMDDANSYLTKLSRLLRKVLNYSDYENISIEKELEMLRLYLELENIRLKGAINYTIDIDEDVDSAEIQIPTLILQPFAENAIWHGLVNKKGEKNLFVHISSVNKTLVCVIEDNGIGRISASSLKKKQSSHISKGMELITRRLEIIKLKSELGNACFTVEDLYTPDQIACGTKIKIILPMPLT